MLVSFKNVTIVGCLDTPFLVWTLAIAAMSSTVIGPRQFVRGVSKHSPVTISESGFASFWQD